MALKGLRLIFLINSFIFLFKLPLIDDIYLIIKLLRDAAEPMYFNYIKF